MVSLLIVLSILMAISWLGWRLVMVEQQRHPVPVSDWSSALDIANGNAVR